MKTDRPVVTGVTPFALIGDWDICQLLITWDHLDPLHPWKTHWEKFHNDICQIFEYRGMNLTLYHLQGTSWSSKSNPILGLGWEFLILSVIVGQLRAWGIPELIISVEDQGKESIKPLCLDFVPVCEVIMLII